MFLLVIFLASVLSTLALSLMAARSDMREMMIDNIYSIAIIGAFILCYGALWGGGQVDVFAPIWGHLGAGAVMFVVTFILFSIGVLGGADSKIASALSLWMGLHGLPIFLIIMTLIGGVLALVTLMLARRPLLEEPLEGSWIARAQGGQQKVPYGVAIAGGAVAAFIQLGYLSTTTWVAFLN